MESDSNKPAFKRVLVKISGEALMGPTEFGIHTPTVQSICEQIKGVRDLGIEIAVVVGGGNIFRGLSAAERGMDRVTGDHIGMLATLQNSLAMMETLESIGVFTRVMSAIRIEAVAEPYIRRRAVRHLEKGRLVIFAAGTGNPYFSTDTAASLRAMEINAEVMIKATNVGGVYSADPSTHPDAELIESLSYMDVLTKELRALDLTAISLLKENNIPVRVIDIRKPGNILRAVKGEAVGSIIS